MIEILFLLGINLLLGISAVAAYILVFDENNN